MQPHYLSGPIRVTDKAGLAAQPGDLLVVEITNLGPLSGDEWGFTGVFDRDNGAALHQQTSAQMLLVLLNLDFGVSLSTVKGGMSSLTVPGFDSSA